MQITIKLPKQVGFLAIPKNLYLWVDVNNDEQQPEKSYCEAQTNTEVIAASNYVVEPRVKLSQLEPSRKKKCDLPECEQCGAVIKCFFFFSSCLNPKWKKRCQKNIQYPRLFPCPNQFNKSSEVTGEAVTVNIVYWII